MNASFRSLLIWSVGLRAAGVIRLIIHPAQIITMMFAIRLLAWRRYACRTFKRVRLLPLENFKPFVTILTRAPAQRDATKSVAMARESSLSRSGPRAAS